jgi:hypothetical protein
MDKKPPNWTTRALWFIYICLLIVIGPHTFWAFRRFEPPGTGGTVVAIAAAFAFELAIAALTHKLARHIEQAPKHKSPRKRWRSRYMNAYAIGLMVAVGVSAMANMAHAVEFGGTLAIFSEWGIPFGVYALTFGAVLPLVSLVFALVLSNVVESEGEANTELTAANEKMKEIRQRLRDTEQRAALAEQRFEAIGDFAVRLASAERRERILAVHERYPELPQRSVALLADSSASYVNQVIASITEKEGEHGNH